MQYRATMLLVAVGLAALGCSAKSSVIFPQTFRQTGFRLVRPCRAPGEHSALNGFTVWVNDAAAVAYDDILSGTAGVHEMPANSIVIKEVSTDVTCSSSAVDRWVAMKKIPGYDPPNGDWMWQEVSGQGSITVEGRVAACTGCHAGADNTTCAGYGAARGMDYLCTAP